MNLHNNAKEKMVELRKIFQDKKLRMRLTDVLNTESCRRERCNAIGYLMELYGGEYKESEECDKVIMKFKQAIEEQLLTNAYNKAMADSSKEFNQAMLDAISVDLALEVQKKVLEAFILNSYQAIKISQEEYEGIFTNSF